MWESPRNWSDFVMGPFVPAELVAAKSCSFWSPGSLLFPPLFILVFAQPCSISNQSWLSSFTANQDYAAFTLSAGFEPISKQQLTACTDPGPCLPGMYCVGPVPTVHPLTMWLLSGGWILTFLPNLPPDPHISGFLLLCWQSADFTIYRLVSTWSERFKIMNDEEILPRNYILTSWAT